VGHFLTPEKISDTYLSRARGLNEIAAARGQSLAQLALSWILRDERVTSVLVGASSVAQLEDTVGALRAPALSQTELEAIEEFAIDGTVR
jgi:L-glyceraldehyde 3-phosphate reductase